ncbi:hypothetical protein ABPG74_011932 [Tetrahymena malaccensis]
MDPHIDDELKEYLRLIDATVKSASANHISPEKGAFVQFPQQFKANELFQNGIKLISNYDEKEQKSSHYPKRKKPEILDDSIDWNIGSQQTTLESPKSQEDIKDLCLGIQSLQCGNSVQCTQNQQSQHFSSLNCITASPQFFQKLQRFFPEQQPSDQLNLSCLCSLDSSSKPSRNMVIQLSQQDDIEQFLAFVRSYGDIQNIDRHKYQLEKIVVLSFYNIQSSLQAYQSISQSYSNKMKVSYLSDFNDFDYIDYMLISNANSFNQKLVLDYLGCFGKILEYSSINSKLVVRYFDVRSLKEVDRIIKLQEKDKKSFIYLHRTHFPEVEEKFILELLKNILIFSKENTTDIILKNARVKSVKQTASQIQQHQQQQPNQPIAKQNEAVIQQLGLLPTSPNNTSSPAPPNTLEIGYNQRLNSLSFFSSNNQHPIQQQNMNNVFNNFFSFDENTSTSFPVIQTSKQDSIYQHAYSNQNVLGMAQNLNQQPQLYGYQQRRELQEISDYQNTFIAQQSLSQSNKQNQFLSSNSSNSLSSQIESQTFTNNENENIHTNKQLQQKKQKKMNPNVNNFSSFNYNSNGSNTNNSNNSNCSSLKLLQSSYSGNTPQIKPNNCQINVNPLQQSISNLQMSQELGSSQQQIQYLQQISQSSSSSLSSTNFPQYSQGHFSNNFNQMRKSQDENPFSASSLRMSFDNNQIYQINNSFYQNNNTNNTSQTNINTISNTQCLNNQMLSSQNNNSVTNSMQLRLQNNQQTQFMNLLNNNSQFLNEMCFNNAQNPNIIEQYEVSQITNNLTGSSSNRQYTNTINMQNNYQTSQASNKVSTILGSNGAKQQNSNQNFQVNLENIATFKDRRATVMVRNIPNRYNQEDFLRIIDINYKGLYDFVYLPMDFKNHCNIGYAFINFIDPKHIIPFYNEFNGKRWEMIRSEKVCYICYARIQGRNELIAHFKKSGVMSALVDKSFKPLILPNPQLDLQILQQ